VNSGDGCCVRSGSEDGLLNSCLVLLMQAGLPDVERVPLGFKTELFGQVVPFSTTC
jgi:hypothetical protein